MAMQDPHCLLAPAESPGAPAPMFWFYPHPGRLGTFPHSCTGRLERDVEIASSWLHGCGSSCREIKTFVDPTEVVVVNFMSVLNAG